jgi:hypothetical protein
MMDGLLLKDFLSAHGPSCSQLFIVHHLAAQAEILGVIAWLLHCCCSLAACAKDMAGARPCLIVAMNTQAWFPQ